MIAKLKLRLKIAYWLFVMTIHAAIAMYRQRRIIKEHYSDRIGLRPRLKK